MEFSRLYAKNFLTIGTASIELANKGLHLVQGVNDDDSSAASNGAGKSSLVDAICWALFGRTARDVKGDAVVNRTAKKECYVTLIMRNGDAIYTVTRYRKHSTGKNTLHLSVATDTTPSVDLSKGTDAETQKEVERVLGCSYEVFMAAVYSGQEVMPDLPRMTDKTLKTLIEESAGLSRIERAYGIARGRMTATAKSMQLVSEARGYANTAWQTSVDNKTEAEANLTLWNNQQGDHTKQLENDKWQADLAVGRALIVVGVAQPAALAAQATAPAASPAAQAAAAVPSRSQRSAASSSPAARSEIGRIRRIVSSATRWT